MSKVKKMFEVNSNGEVYILYKYIDKAKNKKTIFSKSFNKRYSNYMNINKNELKVIANDFLKSFKQTKNLKDYYNFLVYKNVYGDFFKTKNESTNEQINIIDHIINSKNRPIGLKYNKVK